MPDRSDSVYSPAEDTYFLEDHIRGLRGGCALDVGCSSGYLARRLSESFGFVVGTDISFRSLNESGCWTGDRICCSGADAISCRFDLIVCNPPYLATDRILVASTDGGPAGIPVPLKMIRSAMPLLRPDGRLLFVTSSLSDYGALIKRICASGARASILAKKRLFFEELILVEVRQQVRERASRQAASPPRRGASCNARLCPPPNASRADAERGSITFLGDPAP